MFGLTLTNTPTYGNEILSKVCGFSAFHAVGKDPKGAKQPEASLHQVRPPRTQNALAAPAIIAATRNVDV